MCCFKRIKICLTCWLYEKKKKSIVYLRIVNFEELVYLKSWEKKGEKNTDSQDL